jgi:hypothetical protein
VNIVPTITAHSPETAIRQTICFRFLHPAPFSPASPPLLPSRGIARPNLEASGAGETFGPHRFGAVSTRSTRSIRPGKKNFRKIAENHLHKLPGRLFSTRRTKQRDRRTDQIIPIVAEMTTTGFFVPRNQPFFE